MERRTQQGYEYHSCDFMDDGVYIDMNLLREYEDTGLTPQEIMGKVEALKIYQEEGLTPDQIRELKERDAAKAPADTDDEFDMFVCPNCDMAIGTMGDKREHHFCLNCGQRLMWEE